MSHAFRVLYVEDNLQDADLIRSYFSEYAPHFEIEIAATGQECLDRLSKSEPDLLLLDHHLPDMEGLDVLKALINAGVQVPVVLITGLGDEELVVKALRLGAVNYVLKSGNYLEGLPDLLRKVAEEHHRKRSLGLLAPPPRRILYVEHAAIDIDLTLTHFAEAAPHFVVDTVRSCGEGLERLGQPHAYDLALIDLRMPGQSGLDFVREAKRRHLQLPPFIIISGQGDDAAAIATLRLGAADYIVKREGYLNQLVHTIDHAIAYDRIDCLNRQLQAELAERDRLTAAIEQTSETVIITGIDGTILYVNPAFERVTGYSREEAIGQNPRILKSGEHDEAFYRRLWQTIGSGQTWMGRLVNKRKDGARYTEEGTISSVHDATGRIVNYVAVKHDITEALCLRDEKRRLEEQLRQSQKLEAIGSLAGGVAHDFNNMLNVILGYGEIVLGKLQREDPLREKVEQIIKAGRRSAALTRQLLAFSRKQPLQPEVLDLNALLKNLEKMLRRLISEDIGLVLELAEDLGRIKADPGQIEQVAVNLAVNSRDAMPQGGTLTIETTNVELDDAYAQSHLGVVPGRYVMVAVTDTGCGMDKETMSKIFDPFFTTKEQGKGTGLGLSTAYGIVKQSGGNIWAYSEPGHGTTFKIYLPFTQAEPDVTSTQPAKAERQTGGHILVVEDEAALLDLFETILLELGYQVTCAASGGEALLCLEEKGLRLDLVITDVIMPGMNGAALVERLRRNQPGLKALYMSGYADNAIVHHGVLDPGTPFIQKPFNIKDFAVKIEQVMRGDGEGASR